MKRLAMLLLLLPAPAQALDCLSTPPQGKHWSWRQLAGKRCYYVGHRRLDKAALHWENNNKSVEKYSRKYSSDTLTEEDRRIATPLWEPASRIELRGYDSFDRRFNASFGAD